MGTSPDLNRERVAELTVVPRGPLWEAVMEAPDARTLQLLLLGDVQARGEVVATSEHPFDPRNPFVRWPAMNVKAEGGVAAALGRLAQMTFGLDGDSRLVLFGIPRSARFMGQSIMEAGLFPGASVALVTKDPREIAPGTSVSQVDVLSYVHNRRPDGSRGAEVIHFSNPEQYPGATVLVCEDALAQGRTLEGVGGHLRELGAERVYGVVALSKGFIQGGTEAVLASGFFDGLIEAVRVAEVIGPGPARENVIFDTPALSK
ncbi:MAG: hypothetical protein HYS86_02290 [Candidatus Chisholmbacteria bacterium]|nr:hypothetical protein [Candidatus Chisholmbacteria bacterium]